MCETPDKYSAWVRLEQPHLPERVGPGCAHNFECLSWPTDCCEASGEKLEEITREEDVWNAAIVFQHKYRAEMQLENEFRTDKVA